MSSSTSATVPGCRHIWSSQHQLRRQRSLIGSSNEFLNQNFSSFSQTNRTRYSNLQKQFSIDQLPPSNRSVRQKYIINNLPRTNISKIGGSSAVRKNSSQRSQQCSAADGDSVVNVNLKIVPALKKRAPSKGYGENKKDKTALERARKPSKGSDDRLNLKIFLGQSVTPADCDDLSCSDTSGNSDSDQSQDSVVPKSAPQPPDEPAKQEQLKPNRPQFSASLRRTQFQASRAIESINVTSPSLTVTTVPSLTIERRPPLVRAMSAPIRTLDDNSKNILANKRKTRRRKVLSRAPLTNSDKSSNESTVIESTLDAVGSSNESGENLSDRSRGKSVKKSLTRGRSVALGCDVVTLVSLISSEGSDSEKDESIVDVDSNSLKRPPLLRKSGKSVSFQEHEIQNFSNTAKEFPHMLRRGSVAPLAARIRANRPPTAPPGSIFMPEFDMSDSKMSSNKSSSKEELSASSSSQANSKENVPENNNSSSEYQYPEYVRTTKEQECWKLFQKMSKKGITVSYDTVLRGMLTPTELRLIQKQNELEELRKAKEQEKEEIKK